MNKLIKALGTSRLFVGYDETEISDMLLHTRYKSASYSKNRIIALEGEGP